jgi:hypothetical protein
MSRALLAGSLLDQIAGSGRRWPDFQVLVWNPIQVDLADVVTGRVALAGLDLSAFVQTVTLKENIGYENLNDPQPPVASFVFKRNEDVARMRRGLIEDGVIVRVLAGDRRVSKTDWVPVFTGTFRGRPGDDAGTRATTTEGLTADAYGREERFMSMPNVTTEVFPGPVDLGRMAFEIARGPMGLGQDEILFGAFGFESLHVSNQIADLPPLQALYELMFPAGKKPKFDAMGRLTAVDVNFDKPAVRIYTSDSAVLQSLIATPNQVEVNNQVILRGLDHVMTKVVQDPQPISPVNITTGFFDSRFDQDEWYSADHTQRAQDTYVVTKKKIKWAKAKWREVDEFHGRLSIDTHYLATVRETIFAVYLAAQVAIIALDYFFESTTGVVSFVISVFGTEVTIALATLRAALQTTAQLALAALLWAMNYIGSGEYDIWGSPFEYVYQELVSDNRIVGLDVSELRVYDYRNDFISQIEDLDAIGRERLRREMVKNQTFEIKLLDDQLLEVDDVIEIDGSRFYINTVENTLQRGGEPIKTLTVWKIFDPMGGYAASFAEVTDPALQLGYGLNYGAYYGRGL